MSTWASGDTLDSTTLNARMASAGSSAGFSSNTLITESGNTVSLGTYIASAGTFSGAHVGPLSTNTIRAESGNTISALSYVLSATSIVGAVSTNTLRPQSGNVVSTGTFGLNSGGTNLLFADPAQGSVIIGGTAAGATLDVYGTGVYRGMLQVFGRSLVTDGIAAAPSLSFNSETSLGWFRSAASTIALSYGTLTAPSIIGALSANTIRPESGNTASLGTYAISASTFSGAFQGIGSTNTINPESGNTVFVGASAATVVGVSISTAPNFVLRSTAIALPVAPTTTEITTSDGTRQFGVFVDTNGVNVGARSNNNLRLYANNGAGSAIWNVLASGGHFAPATDAVVDIGNPAGARPRDILLNRDLTMAIGGSAGTFNMGQSRLVSVRTTATSLSSAVLLANETAFFIGGASGATLGIRSAGIVYLFNSSSTTIG